MANDIEKTVGANGQHQLEKQYVDQLENGTKVKIGISLEIDNFNEQDFENILSSIGIAARQLYHHTGEQLKRKPL